MNAYIVHNSESNILICKEHGYALIVNTGFQCQFNNCNKLTWTERSMKFHCRNTHDWNNNTGTMWRKQFLQTFFEGQHSKYEYMKSVLRVDCLL